MKISGQGPTYKSCSVNGRQFVVTFTHADGLKTTDGKAPKGFWLAGQESVWQPATASIAGDTVVLEANGLETPVACRYAFCGKPEVNLVNSDSLPAYPFRTDAGIPSATPPMK
jgi:sialate O-acetylesterase